MIKSLAIRLAFVFTFAILSLFAFNSAAHAQDGGGNRMSQRLSGMDENHNGVLEPNEWQNSPMRGFVERVGGESHLDLSKPVSIEKMAEGMNNMRDRGGFGGGGFGGDRGGFGGRGWGGPGGEGRGGWGGGRGGWGGPPGGEGGWGGRGGEGRGGWGRGGNDNNGGDGNRDRDGRDRDRDRDGRDKEGKDRGRDRDGKDKPDSKDGKNDKDKATSKSVNSIVLGFSEPGNVVSTPVLGFSDPNTASLVAKGEGTPEGGNGPSNPGGPNNSGGDERERRERVREMARVKIAQYDENKDNILQKNEWMKISGEPKRADANNDDLITLDEYSNRLWEKNASGGQENWNGGGNNGGGFAGRSNFGIDPNKPKRYLSATERLPEGMPSWFMPADMNGDGQVTMAEYSNNWSDSRLAEFRRIDKNNDGIITSQECVMTPLARPTYASTESNGASADFNDGYAPEGYEDGPSFNGGSDQGRGPRREGGKNDFSRGDSSNKNPVVGAPTTQGGFSGGGPGSYGGGPSGFGNRGGFDRGNFNGGNFDRSRGEGSKGGGPGGWPGYGGRSRRGGDGNRGDGKSNN